MAMIALALGQVKDPPEGEARNGLEVRDLAGLLPRGLTGLQITFGVPICRSIWRISPPRLHEPFLLCVCASPRHTKRKRRNPVVGLAFGGSRVGERPVKLREAASTIFALTAILPLLVFVYCMWRFERLESTEAQIGIFCALVIALLGYVLFRRLTQRVADLGHALGQAMVPADKRVASAP